jgi:hypothetical protein
VEDKLNQNIDSSTDDNIILTRNLVDKYIVEFNIDCNQNERNNHIIKVFKLVRKKYIAPQYEHFEENKLSIITHVTKSYLISIKAGKTNIN